MTLNPELDLVVSRVIHAPRASVWRAWAEPEHLAKWWAPAPIVTVVHQHELRAGGAFHTTMRMEDGTEFGAAGCFLEVVARERIVFTDALREGWRPNKEPFFTAIVTLEEHPQGTRYTATALHHSAAERQKHAEMGFETGWGTCIDQLAALAARL